MERYEQALSYIESIKTFGTKPGQRRIRALLDLLGNPQDRLRAIHVTGTNGKGSTASFCRAILEAAGYTTGLFMSPYVDDFRERIQYAGDLIPKEDLVETLDRVRTCADLLKNLGYMQVGQFELETAMAFDYFARKNVDFAVIEVGIGGKSDTTNILKTTEVAVLTSISLDHTAQLGPTVRDIARDKAGIIKPGCTAVSIAEQAEDAQEEIRAAAETVGAALVQCTLDGVEILRRALDGTTFRYKGLTVTLRMPGAHQVKNAVAAIEAMLALPERERFTKGIMSWVGFQTKWIGYENVERSYGQTKWSMRNLVKYAVSGFVSFATAPLRIAIWLGFTIDIVTLIAGIVFIIRTLSSDAPRTGYGTIVVLIAFFGGTIILLLGIIGEYLSRIYIEVKHRPIFIVKDTNIEYTPVIKEEL